MSSGPATGFGEITLPAVQPGSSIMPGKVNPVMAECLSMVCFRVIGNDTTVAWAASAGQLELNVMMPVIAHNLLQSIELLADAAEVLAEKCVAGIRANREACAGFIERSLALVTSLVPRIGYDRAAAVAQKAHASGRTVREVLIEEKILPEEEIAGLLNI
jgi:fumarate hydratase class II